MRSPARPPALPALLCAWGLSACAPAALPPPPLSLAPSLLTCRPEPAVPELREDADLMRYVLDLVEAGEDCRERLARVREVIGPEPEPEPRR